MFTPARYHGLLIEDWEPKTKENIIQPEIQSKRELPKKAKIQQKNLIQTAQIFELGANCLSTIRLKKTRNRFKGNQNRIIGLKRVKRLKNK